MVGLQVLRDTKYLSVQIRGGPHVCLVGQLVAAIMKVSPKGKSKSLWHLVTASAGPGQCSATHGNVYSGDRLWQGL